MTGSPPGPASAPPLPPCARRGPPGSSWPCRSPRRRPARSSRTRWTRSSAPGRPSCSTRWGSGTRTSRRRPTRRSATCSGAPRAAAPPLTRCRRVHGERAREGRSTMSTATGPGPGIAERDPLSAGELAALDAHWRAANFLGSAQIYLRDNALLEAPLRPEHIKPRLLGHWGTVPGINFLYAHLNRLIRAQDAEILLVTGPGHGAPANLANLFLEGSLGEFYPELGRDRAGLERLVRGFSWPGGFPSHLTPGTPGTIHEGGELGYALATAFGAALDNPGLIVACIVGDGEAETGPTATAWHGTKYLDPARDGAVLPVLHLNGYKISSATVFGTMSDEGLTALFRGYGYEFTLVDVRTPDDHAEAHRAMARALDRAYGEIRRIQR